MSTEAYDLDIYPVLEYHGLHNIYETSSWHTIKCPYHDDGNASARTNGKGFMCHACGMKGGAISLLMEVDGLDFRGAIARYEEITGASVPRVSGKSSGYRRRKVSLEQRDYERDSSIFSVGVRKTRRKPFSRP